MDKKQKFNVGYVVAALAIIGLFQFWFAYRDTAQISYSDVMSLTQEGKIASVTLTETMIEGTFKEPQDGKTMFLANRVDPAAVAVFEKAGVKITGASDSNWLTTLLSWILPALFFVGIWMFFFRGIAERQGMGGLINIGKSKAKVHLVRDTGVTFDDVAGADEAKTELQEIVSFLKDTIPLFTLTLIIPAPAHGWAESSATMFWRICSSSTATGPGVGRAHSRARRMSERVTIPTTLAPSTTGMRLTWWRVISSTTSSSDASRDVVMTFSDITSETRLPLAWTYSSAALPGLTRNSSQRERLRFVSSSPLRRKSPSLTIPTSVPSPRMTGRPLILRDNIDPAAWEIDAEGSMLATGEVIIVSTCIVISFKCSVFHLQSYSCGRRAL